MAGYNGRRAPNFSQYLDDLNAIPSPYDQAVQQQQQQQNSFNVDEELALFTNAEFFDFDKFGGLSLPTFDSVDNTKTNDPTSHEADMKFLDFLNDGLGNIPDYPTDYNTINPQTAVPASDSSFSTPPNGSVAATQAPQAPAPVAPVAAPTLAPALAPNPSSTTAAAAGPKRKHTQKSTQASAEEAALIAADEDKRRRNTAASARFRVKKKMREAALERTVNETNEKNSRLEARVGQLELENNWLRGLIMEKNGDTKRNEAAEKKISDMFQQFLASRNSESSESKLGVGTTA
ncbi:hypothetical protein N7474_008634 [Penicillium riverlandense]|uniref:uncharacterized protein n=1 Tax=Penicillium riverlandense TaxID=1903569 RepID=UPI0025481144|nr:uncharacterized protein N7474_008634 [Penicillium riverlandense]KAJ5812333.1 hypothetical protein N7474_008634 [Penicillium riverlandense]